QASPAFAPGVKRKGPGPPAEHGNTAPGEGGDVKTYTASYADRSPNGVLIYEASVLEYPTETPGSLAPAELLTAYLAGTARDETSRKQIAFGPNKYPGFDITSRPAGSHSRQRPVLAGQRIYAISVTRRNEELIHSPEAEAFLGSLEIPP